MENGKSRSWEEFFCKYFANVSAILNIEKEMYIHLKAIPKEDTIRCWRFCWLGNWQNVADQTLWWKVTQIDLLRQKSVENIIRKHLNIV